MTKLTAAISLLLCCICNWRIGCVVSTSESNCLYSRLDFFNCIPHADTSLPGPNEYAFYRTNIQINGIPECRYLDPNRNRSNEIIRPIDNLGDPNVRLLYSPGHLRNQRYPDNVLVSYNMQCPEGRLPYLIFNEHDLPNKQCFGLCEDYVNITCAGCGSSESCGTQPTDNHFNLEQDHVSVTFRSSQLQSGIGFKLTVICFEPMNKNKAGCSKFGPKNKRDLEIYERLLEDAVQVGMHELVKDIHLHQKIRYAITKVDGQILNIELSASEMRMLTDVTNELFNLIPPSNDIDISQIDKVCSEDCPELCKLPPVNGYCRARFTRWFHNSASGQCETFIYGGCGGNKNNFRTLEDCQQHCSPQPAVTPFVSCPRRLVSTAAIRTCILFEKSCNPVVNALAASTLSIAKRQNPSRVRNIRKTIDLERRLLPRS